MITKLINFIGNKKVILGFIVILIIGYSFFFYTTKKEFDTDDDGKIDKVEYYHKGVKVKEVIYSDSSDNPYIEYRYWNSKGGLGKNIILVTEPNYPYPKTTYRFDSGERIQKFGKDLLKQVRITVEEIDKNGKVRKKQRKAKVCMYSQSRNIFFLEVDDTNKGIVDRLISFDPHGRIFQTKEDKDSNGKFEYYEFYEHGKKTAVGYDYDEDGEIDKKEEVKNKQKG